MISESTKSLAFQAVKVVILMASMAISTHATAATTLPDDPLESVMWSSIAERFLTGGEIVFDQRVKVSVPLSAEDQFYVPVTVDATELEDVIEIVALADLNPIPHILTLRPLNAQPFIGFRVKLQQATPIRIGVRTKDKVWHVNGVNVDAAGGGCTAPAMAHGLDNWMDTLGHTRAIARRESSKIARMTVKMNHPMDTGLAAGIPFFYMSQIRVNSASGKPLADVDLYEPVSENPTLTLKPSVGLEATIIQVLARDTEGHEFEFPLNVPAATSN